MDPSMIKDSIYATQWPSKLLNDNKRKRLSNLDFCIQINMIYPDSDEQLVLIY